MLFRSEIKHREGAEYYFRVIPKILNFKRIKTGFYDNSFKNKLLSNNFVDLVIFAGTPEWASYRMKILYDYIEKYSIPVIYLGIGVGSEDFNFDTLDAKYKAIISRALLITVRDATAERALSNLNAHYLPCPAFISAPSELEKKIDKIEKIGLIYMSNTGVKSNKISQHDYVFLINLYNEILRRYQGRFHFEFVSHYIDELVDFSRDLPDKICHYSYDSSEYARIYHKFDFVIGPRVHGIGIAASMGIPGICIQHDARAGTCKGFFAEIISTSMSIDSALKIFDEKINEIHSKKENHLLLSKKKVFSQYVDLIAPVLRKM